ncbi:MAG: protein kinase [Gemmatimonadetes bacterium]|nr:protein kinase [Gemmatimonadota bacterium]
MTNLSKVGKYEVQDLIGEGAMGVVYRALDPMLNRSVAVKVMNEALALDENFRTRFLREARAAGSLQHPNVITVYDCGETDGHLYIAMEYVAGTDLEQLIASKVPVSLANKIEIMIGVLNGLAYAHKRGIVHRDMKPANIRVNEEGRALIMDFGIAHTTSSNVTKTGLILGTPNYMAPEQITGSQITAQTDIFAVGVVLYELLTNIKPFEGGTLHSVLFRIVSEDPESPDKIVAGVRPDLAEIVMKALAKEPADRYASALDMANALSKISAAITAGGSSGSRTLSLRSSIELALGREAKEKEKERERELDKERRRSRIRLAGVAALAVVAVGAALTMRGGGSAPSAEAVATQQSTSNVTSPVTSPAPTLSAPKDPTPPPVTSTRPPTVSTPVVTPRTTARSDPAPAVAATDMSPALSVQVSAQLARRRAVEAGAATSQLAGGDQRLTAGAQFVKKNQRDAAMREFTQASVAFAEVESAARVAAAAREAAKESASAVREPPKAAPAVVAAVPQPVQTAPSQPASNPSAEIAGVVAQYARAIESRDVGELKRLYPAMSASQANAFEEFFKSVRSVRASFSVSGLQVDGSTADAKLSGTYDFVTSNGRNEHQPLTLQASLRKDGSSWRFVSIK